MVKRNGLGGDCEEDEWVCCVCGVRVWEWGGGCGVFKILVNRV